jgi:hypothetical protein
VANGSILQLGSAVQFLTDQLADVIESMLIADYRNLERWFTFDGVLPAVDRLLFQGRTE